MQNRGQNLIEFLVIIAVVVVGGILVLTLLGGNINTMFGKTTEHVNNFDPFNSKGNVTTVTGSSTVNGVPVEVMNDGSAVIEYNGQTVTITSDVLNNLNTVFETSGADGITTEVMKAIQQMIDDNKAAYAPDEVPLEITFGNSSRKETSETEAYDGGASINQVTMTVGKDTKIIVQDHTEGSDPALSGTYIIDGEFDGTNFHNDTMTFIDGSGTSFALQKPEDSKTAASVSGSTVNIDYNNVKIYQASTVPDADAYQYDWNISFDMP